MKKHLYSEIFYSPQGEGYYTGVPTVWVRFFLCNLQCDGFGQDDPTDPSTYELPYKTFDLIPIKRIEDLPVFDKGCDSSYSWAKRYKHLSKSGTAEEIAEAIVQAIKSPTNPYGKFRHPKSGVDIHLAFTGGEPMLNQDAIVEILSVLEDRGNAPEFITIETNGTRALNNDFIHYMLSSGGETFMSVSPKLFNVSGEKNSVAIKPDIVSSYCTYFPGQLKFVLSPSDAAWQELDRVINAFRGSRCDYPVWIMPVGATDAGQQKTAADVARLALEHGYNISARAHVALFGNCIGT